MNGMTIADELRLAGLAVIEGRPGLGSRSGVTELVFSLTRTAVADEGAADVNALAIPQRAVGYIERSGRVWLLADGPTIGNVATVLIAAFRDDAVTDEQHDAVDVMTAILSARYGLGATDAPTGDAEPTGDDQGDGGDD